MTVKTQKPTGLHLDKAREGSKNGSTVPHFSPTLGEVINVCPKSEKIIKEASVKWRKAMEMLADL